LFEEKKPETTSRTGHWYRILRLAGVALLLGSMLGIIGYTLIASAAYAHGLTHPGCQGLDIVPGNLDIGAIQDIVVPSHDGLRLRAWYLPPEKNTVIILLPGLGGSRDGMLNEGTVLAQHGYGILATDLRSCAHPEGLSTLGYLEAADLHAATSWVLDQPGVEHVAVLGFSLGGVTSILAAAENPRIEAVVAEGGFYDLADDIANTGGQNTIWQRIVQKSILLFFRRETNVNATDISPISVIGQISPRPILLIYGELEADEGHARQQFSQADSPKELWIVPDCGHGGYLQVAPDEWEHHVISFFDKAFAD